MHFFCIKPVFCPFEAVFGVILSVKSVSQMSIHSTFDVTLCREKLILQWKN